MTSKGKMLREESDHEIANYASQQNYGNVEESWYKICASDISFCVLNFEP